MLLTLALILLGLMIRTYETLQRLLDQRPNHDLEDEA
jgi:hypothetical protein